MKSIHLSEKEIQRYVIDPSDSETELVEHIHLCASCSMKASNYRLLFSQIKSNPKPSFDFDLTATVMEQIPSVKPVKDYSFYVLTVLAIAAVCAPVVLFANQLLNLFSSVSSISLLLILVIALPILSFEIFNTIKKHNRLLHSLDSFENTLQH